MSAPRRLLDEPDQLSPSERRALLAGQQIEAPEAQRDAIWSAIASGLPPAAAPPAPPAAPAPTGALTAFTSSLAFKTTVMIASVASISVAAYQYSHRTDPSRSPASSSSAGTTEECSGMGGVAKPSPSASAAERTEPTDGNIKRVESNATRVTTAAPSSTTTPAVVNTATPTSTSSSATTTPNEPQEAAVVAPVASAAEASEPKTEAMSEARQESLLVGQARDAVRRGDGAAALRILEEARVKYPRGVLGQEREALSIEALAASGQSAAATQRATAFIQGHPDSPYVARLRRFVP